LTLLVCKFYYYSIMINWVFKSSNVFLVQIKVGFSLVDSISVVEIKI
jgi:hypothetical protein